MKHPQLTTIDGGPGTGKSTTIINNCKTIWKGKRVVVVTYTNSAADVLRLRAPWVTSGTVYSLLWPFVGPVIPPAYRRKKHQKKAKSGYQVRSIENSRDQELNKYGKDAPSNQAKSPDFIAADMLHAWNGSPDYVPIDLETVTPDNELQYILPIAYWLSIGGPMHESQKYDIVVIDEAQDMSALEVSAALLLLKEDGQAYAYGDPGQAIFSESKGLEIGGIPYAWEACSSHQALSQGYRCGPEVAEPASAVLSDYYQLGAHLFTADHSSGIHRWNPSDRGNRPKTGMVLCHSRRNVVNTFHAWGLNGTPIVPGIADPNKQLIICTGHAAKGAEADDVYVTPWARPATERLYAGDPSMVKLLYVMMTRARYRLHLPGSLAAFVEAKEISYGTSMG